VKFAVLTDRVLKVIRPATENVQRSHMCSVDVVELSAA